MLTSNRNNKIKLCYIKNNFFSFQVNTTKVNIREPSKFILNWFPKFEKVCSHID